MNPLFPQIIRFIRSLYNQPEGFIPLHAPVFAGNEMKYLKECIDTTFVSSVGKFVDAFEEKMAAYTGAKKAVVCVNGTNALHLALKLAGVEPGTEVITQPLTFIATANAISYCGAKPVFLDVDMDTLGLSPTALRTWLENNTKHLPIAIGTPNNKPQTINKKTGKPITACVPMHTFGHPCRIDEIVEICNEYNIPVVEDAAESLGSFYKGIHTGTFGEIGVLSFNGNKIITTGGGGMLLFKDENLAQRAKHLTTQAKVMHPWEFVHDEIGYNYRMPNINAALGLAQLEQLPRFLESKRQIAKAYESFFNELNNKEVGGPDSYREQRHPDSYREAVPNKEKPDLKANPEPGTRNPTRPELVEGNTEPQTPNLKQNNHPNTNQPMNHPDSYRETNQPINQSTIHYFPELPESRANFWLNCILLPNRVERDTFLKYSNENGVMTRPAWKLMNELDMFKDFETDRLGNSKRLWKRLVNVPSGVIS